MLSEIIEIFYIFYSRHFSSVSTHTEYYNILELSSMKRCLVDIEHSLRAIALSIHTAIHGVGTPCTDYTAKRFDEDAKGRSNIL